MLCENLKSTFALILSADWGEFVGLLAHPLTQFVEAISDGISYAIEYNITYVVRKKANSWSTIESVMLLSLSSCYYVELIVPGLRSN